MEASTATATAPTLPKRGINMETTLKPATASSVTKNIHMDNPDALETPQTIPAQTKTQPPAKPRMPSWEDIAKQPATSKLSKEAQTKLAASQKAFREDGFVRDPPRPPTPRPNPKPIPTPVYFGGVPRGPIGTLRRALQLAMPKWAILNLSFIGNVALEVLCHKHLVDRLIADMKLLNYRHLPAYTPISTLDKGTEGYEKRIKILKAAAYRRWTWLTAQKRAPAAKKWYYDKAAALIKEDPSLETSLAPKKSTPATATTNTNPTTDSTTTTVTNKNVAPSPDHMDCDDDVENQAKGPGGESQ